MTEMRTKGTIGRDRAETDFPPGGITLVDSTRLLHGSSEEIGSVIHRDVPDRRISLWHRSIRGAENGRFR